MPPNPLPKELTYFSATALVISNMIGTGIFTTTGFLARDLGNPILVLGVWAAGGLVALGGCLAYSELGVNLPRSGGEYVYLREAWGPTWGFMSGWVSFFAGFSAPIAAGALAVSEYLGHFIPFLATVEPSGMSGSNDGGFLNPHLDAGRAFAVLLVLLFAVANIVGLRLAARLQNVLTSLKVGIIVTLLILAVAVGNGDWGHLRETTETLSPHGLPAQFAVSLVFIMFAYSGWNAATYVTGELREPKRTLPRVLVSGTLLVILLYLCLNLIFIYALPPKDMLGVVKIGAVSATALFGPKTGAFFSGILALCLVSTVGAMMITGPRVYYAMASDGCFFRSAARIHPRWRSPYLAILCQSLAVTAMILLGNFESLLYYIGFSLIFFTSLTTAGLMKLRRRPGWQRTQALSRLYPAIPLGFILVTGWMLLYSIAVRPYEAAWGVGTIAAGGLAYYFWLRGRQYPAGCR